MKIVIPGGSGQIGSLLARALVKRGDEVVILSRSPRNGLGRWLPWDGRTVGEWAAELEGADAVINLAGRSVDCRYTKANRQAILDSRVLSTRAVGEAIRQASSPPRVWLQASTATIYSHRLEADNDERDGILGGSEDGVPGSWKFSTEVATAWEREVDRVELPHTRKVKLRSAITFSPDHGGVFDVLLRLTRFGLAGRWGDGRQYVSWIHEVDFIAAVLWLVESAAADSLDGAVNLSAPQPLPQVEFVRELRRAWGTSIGLPASRWMLELGSFALRTETELVLKSRRVVPTRLSASGFEFSYPSWSDAVADLVARRRVLRDGLSRLRSGGDLA